MSDILKKICEKKAEYIKLCKQKKPLFIIEQTIKNAPPPRGFISNLNNFVKDGKLALIAEIKKASPSAGIIKENFNPAVIAKEYEKAGACCLSVLTETDFFMGNDDDLTAARKASSLPILRKDFILDTYQIAEARAIGADCILLIMAALDDNQAIELEKCANDYHLDVLVEVHNETELARALKLNSPLIGINNRNLKTLKTDIATTEELAKLVPKDREIVSESGLYKPSDLERMAAAGAFRFLIGHSLMQSDNIFEAVKKLLTRTHMRN